MPGIWNGKGPMRAVLMVPTNISNDALGVFQLPSSVKVRLLLVEGSSESVFNIYRSSHLSVPQQYFDFHQSNAVPSVRAKFDFQDRSFFAKWSRYIWQSPKRWGIEQRIETGLPYNINTVTDPDTLRLDHERYSKLLPEYRSYDPISKTKSNYHGHAAQEIISVFWKKLESSWIGVSIFDFIENISLLTDLQVSSCSTQPASIK
jgi:hypothetical protein